MSRHVLRALLFPSLAFLAFALAGLFTRQGVSAGETGTKLPHGWEVQQKNLKPAAGGDANVHFVYQNSDVREITVTQGTTFTLDMYLKSGSGPAASAAQSYLSFSPRILQVSSPILGDCTPSNVVVQDPTYFDFELQNEVCNGPAGCNFRGALRVPPGSIAFASGGLGNCYFGCSGDFRVAQLALCATGTGRGVLHWQFNPPDSLERDTNIVAFNGDPIQDKALYHDLIVNVLPSGTPTPTPTACTLPFSDVQPGDYFYNMVRDLYCRGAITGYADGTFRPSADTTRAQLCKIIVLANGWPADTDNGPTFRDVPETDPFYPYIQTAYNYLIIDGYSDHTFHPSSNVTRGQLAKIVVLSENWPLSYPSLPTFKDVPKDSTFYTYVESAYCHGIISGYSDGTFKWGNNATRGQISKIVDLAIMAPAPCQ